MAGLRSTIFLLTEPGIQECYLRAAVEFLTRFLEIFCATWSGPCHPRGERGIGQEKTVPPSLQLASFSFYSIKSKYLICQKKVDF
mmetsp:Transcript_7571/g.18786  ORF Transcript_7571/g.18786 Transcript_7571/m.18786 type:complete len:85 (-) Transcript_7571:58-312(-)